MVKQKGSLTINSGTQNLIIEYERKKILRNLEQCKKKKQMWKIQKLYTCDPIQQEWDQINTHVPNKGVN